MAGEKSFFPEWAGFQYQQPQPTQQPAPVQAPPPEELRLIGDHPADLVELLGAKEQEKIATRSAMLCEYCNHLIELDDPCIELFIGICGPSRRSGRLMVVEDPREMMNPSVKLHMECVSGYAMEMIEVSEHHFEPQFCARCEELIEID